VDSVSWKHENFRGKGSKAIVVECVMINIEVGMKSLSTMGVDSN